MGSAAVEEPAEVKSEGLEVDQGYPQTPPPAPPPPEQQVGNELPEPAGDANNDEAATLAELWPSRRPKSDSSTTSGRGTKIVKKATALKTRKKSGSKSTPKLTLSLRSGRSRSYEKYASSANVSVTPSPRGSLSAAMVRAEEIRKKLDPNFPTFVKSMVRSHVAGCFFMGLPGPFCKAHLPEIETVLIVEDEHGKQYDVKYLGHKTGLSAGWRQFSIEHNLLEKDVLVFQLLEASKLKVHIIRAAAIGAEVERTVGILNLDSPAEIRETHVAPAGTVDPTPGKRKRRKSLPLSILQKKKKSRKQNALTAEIVRSAEQSGNHSEEIGSEVLESSRLNVLKVQFQDVTAFEDFRILIDGVLVDPEFLEDTRSKYYDLCSSQKEFLHENLMEGINLKLIIGAISEIVSISDAIKACDLTTTRDKFSSWVRTLSAFELLGMNVGFLRKRVERLITLAFECERSDEARKLAEAKSRRASVEEEIKKLESRLLELEEVTQKLGTEIQSLGPRVESFEVQFQEEVSAPW